MRTKRVESLVVILGLLLPAAASAASRVLSVTSNQEQVTVSYDDIGRRWQLNDSLCLFQNKRELACGFVGRLTSTEIVVKISTRAYRILPGQGVELRRDVRYPSSMSSNEMAVARDNPKLDVSLGLMAGFNYFYPTAQLQFALFRTMAIGIQPLYAKFSLVDGDVQAVGGFVNFSYYYTHYPFRGFFVNAGAGFYSITETTSTMQAKLTPLALTATAQWRGKPHWGLGIDIGVGVGLQVVLADSKVATSTGGTIDNRFSGLLPVFNLYLGYSF